ncbi:MAG: thioesterase family protein [Gemmatimonadota bacterium]
MSDAIELTIYPDQCDSFGHLNQASYLALFERARWEVLRHSSGMDVFTRNGVWPAVRKAIVEYHAGVWPGDALRFDLEITHRGRTSFTLKQHAYRKSDGAKAATLECVYVCINQRQEPVPVPEEVLTGLAG